jgi:hypothetical protein
MFNFEHTYLTNIFNLLSYFKSKLTYWYEQLQLNIIDELSLVSVRTLNIINNWLRVIKHIQNQNFGGLNVVMSSEFL